MKLELKHLAPYSNHELLFLAENEIWQLTTIEFKSKYPIWANNYWHEKKHYFFPEINKKDSKSGQGFKLKKIKPILRPLSDLIKEVDNKKQFRYKDYLEPLIGSLDCSFFSDWTKINIENVHKFNYKIIQKLHEMHFDIYGLIEQGLAIDINTLEK